MRSAIRPLCVLAVLLGFAACQSGANTPPKPGALPADASVTVFPVLLAGKPSPEVANVVGILLERGGLQHVELETAAFTPEKGQDLAAQAAAFGDFASKRELKTDCALFAAFLGTPRGVEAVRGALVDKTGRVVWSEEQKPGSPAFDQARPGEPMECAVLLAQRLREPLQLADPLRQDAPASRLGQEMSAKAGVPPQAELDAMEQRLAALRRAGKPRLRVYPARIGADWSAESAKVLAAAIEKAGIAQATAEAEPIRFRVQASPNEQQVLWSAAKSIQEAVRAAPAQPDYLLFTDFLVQPGGPAGAVHTFLLSPAGEFVIVDYQNSHHEDFRRSSPASAADCSELAAVRLASRLK